MGQSRNENILEATIAGTSYSEPPQSRIENLLLQLKEAIEQGGGGSTPTASDVSYDNTTSGMTADDVQDAIDEVFQSVSSGKTLIAGAITDKGVTTSASDTFATMATNIAAIPTGGGKVYLIATSSTGDADAAVRVKIFENGELISNNNYQYKQIRGQWVNISDSLRIGYEVGGLSYSWKLEVKSGKVYDLGNSTEYEYTSSNILIDNWQYNTSRTFYLVDEET